MICAGHPDVALQVAGAFRRSSRNNIFYFFFSHYNWKKWQILLLRWLIFMLKKEAIPLWESCYSLAASNTGCHLSIKREKKLAWPLHRTTLHRSGETREIIKGMLWWSIWLGPRMIFPFGKFWCSGFELLVQKSHPMFGTLHPAVESQHKANDWLQKQTIFCGR